MRGDFSRFSFNPSKPYLAAFMQQGRLQLDSDWNENVESFLNVIWNLSRDTLGISACIGDSFRIGRDIPIDHMLETNHWKPVPLSGQDDYQAQNAQGYIFVNTNDRPRANPNSIHEKGSLFVENARGIERDYNNEDENLDLSRFKSIYLKFKVVKDEIRSDKSSQHLPLLRLILHTSNNTDYEFKAENPYEHGVDAGEFFKAKFDLLHPQSTIKEPDKFDLSHISKMRI